MWPSSQTTITTTSHNQCCIWLSRFLLFLLCDTTKPFNWTVYYIFIKMFKFVCAFACVFMYVPFVFTLIAPHRVYIYVCSICNCYCYVLWLLFGSMHQLPPVWLQLLFGLRFLLFNVVIVGQCCLVLHINGNIIIGRYAMMVMVAAAILQTLTE